MTAEVRSSRPALAPVLLSFRLGADDYAVELARVREVVLLDRVDWLPGFAPAVRGVVDLRGEPVLAVDLATAIGLAPAAVTAESSLVVVEAGRPGETGVVGLIVDSVRDIVEVDAAELSAAATRLADGVVEPLSGVVGLAGGAMRVVDLDRLLGANPWVRGPADLAAAGSGGLDGGTDLAAIEPGAAGWGDRPFAAVSEPVPAGETDGAAGERRPHIVFAVAGLSFALPIAAVERIVRPEKVAPVPAAPAILRGLVPAGDELVAVLDLAAVFARASAAPSAESSVLIAPKGAGSGTLAAGLLVDEVQLVRELGAAEILAPPRGGGLFAAERIAGLACAEGGFVPILDLPSLLALPAVRLAVEAASAVVAGAGAPGAVEGRTPAPTPEGEPTPKRRPRSRRGRGAAGRGRRAT